MEAGGWRLEAGGWRLEAGIEAEIEAGAEAEADAEAEAEAVVGVGVGGLRLCPSLSLGIGLRLQTCKQCEGFESGPTSKNVNNLQASTNSEGVRNCKLILIFGKPKYLRVSSVILRTI